MVLCSVPSGGFLGLGIGTLRYFLNYQIGRQSRGLCMRSAAICTLVVTVRNSYHNYTRNQQVNSLGHVPVRRKKYLTNLRKADVDDWCLIGGLLGIALITMRLRSPSVTGWKRYLGASSIGSFGGMNAYHFRHQKEARRAAELQKVFLAKAEASSRRADEQEQGVTKDPDRED
ncbi:MAG: hypothetical protein M1830_003829 [Pleopsidium flavum]|nr:MAG: hypothetical protein M1830_003829 [Pleopsidium flavum]